MALIHTDDSNNEINEILDIKLYLASAFPFQAMLKMQKKILKGKLQY